MDIADVGTLADENRFDFKKHQLREGVIDKQGRTKLTPEEIWARTNSHKCDTVTMFHSDGRTVEINAHEKDSLAEWRKLGYLTQADIDAPKLATEARIRQAADLVEAVRTIQGEIAPVKKSKADKTEG